MASKIKKQPQAKQALPAGSKHASANLCATTSPASKPGKHKPQRPCTKHQLQQHQVPVIIMETTSISPRHLKVATFKTPVIHNIKLTATKHTHKLHLNTYLPDTHIETPHDYHAPSKRYVTNPQIPSTHALHMYTWPANQTQAARKQKLTHTTITQIALIHAPQYVTNHSCKPLIPSYQHVYKSRNKSITNRNVTNVPNINANHLLRNCIPTTSLKSNHVNVALISYGPNVYREIGKQYTATPPTNYLTTVQLVIKSSILKQIHKYSHLNSQVTTRQNFTTTTSKHNKQPIALTSTSMHLTRQSKVTTNANTSHRNNNLLNPTKVLVNIILHIYNQASKHVPRKRKHITSQCNNNRQKNDQNTITVHCYIEIMIIIKYKHYRKHYNKPVSTKTSNPALTHTNNKPTTAITHNELTDLACTTQSTSGKRKFNCANANHSSPINNAPQATVHNSRISTKTNKPAQQPLKSILQSFVEYKPQNTGNHKSMPLWAHIKLHSNLSLKTTTHRHK
eukprot:gene2923-1905_t